MGKSNPEAIAGYEIFYLPTPSKTLSEASQRDGLGRHDYNFQLVYRSLENLGLEPAFTLPTRKAHWAIHQKVGFEVTKFPEPKNDQVTRDLAVALYQTNKNHQPHVEHVIARFSAEPLNRQELEKDLASFTKNYIERPFALGLPSTLTRLDTSVNLGGLIGVGIAAAISGSNPEGQNLGMILGVMAGTAIGSGTLSYLMWRRVGKEVSDPGQYVADNNATELLTNLENHRQRVALKSELLAAFRLDDPNLTPDDFLTRIYKNLPVAILEDRESEFKREIPPEESPALKALVAHGKINLSYQSGNIVI